MNKNAMTADSALCPYCSGVGKFFISSTDTNRQTTDVNFAFFQCKDCGLVFMYPVPRNMRPYYEGGYQTIPNNLSELREIAAKEKYRMKPILRHKSGGKLLDIGPWMGIFSCNAKDAGFDVAALEIDEGCVDFLNNVVGVESNPVKQPCGNARCHG